MNNLLKQEVLTHGARLQIVPIENIEKLKDEIDEFKSSEELNGFQNWIVNSLYNFQIPKTNFVIRTILLLAIPHPFYAEVEFDFNDKIYRFKSLVRSDFDGTEKYLKEFVAKNKYHIRAATGLPMKRLAVQSNLAVYGRNNITYIEGMGSNFSYIAYFSDMPCDKNEWRKMCHATLCDGCNICQNNCPTGAISKERFLIDNQKCLSVMNESPGEFPEWVPVSAHHTLYDCLKCQEKCPMNHGYLDDIIGHIRFSEEETKMILEGKPFELFSDEFNEKAKLLGLAEWYKAIPRNLKVLIETSEV